MATQAPNGQRKLHETEYRTWAQICLDKHGTPWPVAEEDLATTSDEVLMAMIKMLKMLGRTPHEG